MIESYCETCDKSVVGRFCTDCGKETVERKPVESPPSQAVGPAPQKIMAGGDLTHNVTHTNTNTTTVKVILNSIIYTHGSKFTRIDLKDFYLNTPMEQP